MTGSKTKEIPLPGTLASFDDQAGHGLGLLLRFLGAIFLILVAGLLLLDHALLTANREQANLDTQAASLLAEGWIAEEAALLERWGAAVHWDSPNPPFISGQTAQYIRHREELRGAWVQSVQGSTRIIARAESSTVAATVHPPDSSMGTALVEQVSDVGRSKSILLREVVRDSTGRVRGAVGLVINPEGLRRALSRLIVASRLTLVVQAGKDTLIAIGEPGTSVESLGEAKRTVRLPNGGTWTLATTHALTSRSLRWAIWALGIMGVVFLAIGLLREQRRALHAAGRSVELERLYRDVKRANQAKSEFLANVSHELRTPLNAIVGFVELLREGFYGDLTPRQVPPVDRIAASATHLRHLVDQVLDIAKIAAGRLEVHPETIVLRPFVLNIASELESLVGEKGLSFSITIGASLPRVRTDPSHLRQILINLIGNAIKYTQSGTISIRTRLVGAPAGTNTPTPLDAAVQAPGPGTWIALQIADTGVGIAPSDQERIFDEFEQVNAGPRGDSMHRGTGLGLPISRRLARLLGGDITVESDLGRGATFTIWLTVNAADLVRDPVVVPSDQVASA